MSMARSVDSCLVLNIRSISRYPLRLFLRPFLLLLNDEGCDDLHPELFRSRLENERQREGRRRSRTLEMGDWTFRVVLGK
jgi:hypothetical protein